VAAARDNSGMARVTLYGKPGCHLCDDARAAVARVRAERPFELEEVDVTLDPALHRRYGERIPVLELDGEPLFEYHVDERTLKERLDRVDAT
jgi:glutaredoxin